MMLGAIATLLAMPIVVEARPTDAGEASFYCHMDPNNVEGQEWRDYIFSMGSIFAPMAMVWDEGVGGCVSALWEEGNTHFGAINRVVVRERRGTQALVHFFLAGSNDAPRSPVATATLNRKYSNGIVTWEGIAVSHDLMVGEPVYLKEQSYHLQEPSKPDRSLKHLVDHDFRVGEGHGAYYCGDGGCDGPEVLTIVGKNDVASFKRDLNLSGFEYVNYYEIADEFCEIPAITSAYSSGFTRAHFDAEGNRVDPIELDAVCFDVVAVPLREPQLTIALRSMPQVQFARRYGGMAGTYATSFSLSTLRFLDDYRNLDVLAASTFFDNALRKYYLQDDADIEVLAPVFRDNSLIWQLKGRRVAFEKRANFSGADEAEWWKIQIQMAIFQQNYGTYYLSLGLPETRVAYWGFDEFPADEKFEGGELTNDERFLDFRDRLMGVLTKDVAGTMFAG